jgi:hypothetical protein
MKLDIRALSIAGAIFCGGMFFLLGVANLVWPPYGRDWLDLFASVYPGYQVTASFGAVIVLTLYAALQVTASFGAVIVLTLYAALDGAIAGAVLAWLYNRFARGGNGRGVAA